MGLAKQWMIEQMERGYDAVDGNICPDCVTDDALAKWIRDQVSATQCSFCGASSDAAIAADFDTFVGEVLAGLCFEWNDPADEGIMYISAEGGFQAPTSDTYEILRDYGVSEDDDVIDALCGAISTETWVQREYYRGDDGERLAWGWEAFKHLTKNETRYFFLQGESDDDELTPAEMLRTIAGMIRSKFGNYDLIQSIPASTDIVRIRIDVEPQNEARAIGTPPPHFATQSNRMSPAGIPMFYGAFDADTAWAETFDPALHAGQVASVGTFRPTRDLEVLDLAQLPQVPSIFDSERRNLLYTLRFLHRFADDVSKPIARDGREHIEYVPTQIVTEYFRRVFRTDAKETLDGIVYRSSRHDADRAVVLFAENENCFDTGGPDYREDLLELVSVEHRDCPAGSAGGTDAS